MQVILLQDIKGVGKKNELKNVADGYGKNFLIARGLAVLATKESIAAKADKDAEKEAEFKRLQKDADKLKSENLQFKVKVGDKNSVFESISREDIKNALKAKGYSEININIQKPLKTLGEHILEINLGKGIKTNLKIIILPKNI